MVWRTDQSKRSRRSILDLGIEGAKAMLTVKDVSLFVGVARGMCSSRICRASILDFCHALGAHILNMPRHGDVAFILCPGTPRSICYLPEEFNGHNAVADQPFPRHRDRTLSSKLASLGELMELSRRSSLIRLV